MNYTKNIIILANSRKNNHYCVAGKELDSRGNTAWIRPVSSSEGGELTLENTSYGPYKRARVLDIAGICFQKPVPKNHQTENHLIDETQCWRSLGRFDSSRMNYLLDTPEILWYNSPDSSQAGINDRIHESNIGCIKSSLLFIKPENVTIRVSAARDSKKKVQANFRYNNDIYRICVTDPAFELKYQNKPDGEYCLNGDVYFCMSLGVLFMNYYYKLVAGIITV